MTDAFLDDFLTWTEPDHAADNRARFVFLRPRNGRNSLLLRDLHFTIDRAGNKDWLVEYTDLSGRTWNARSDTTTGAVLNLLARMCSLDGEIRGVLPAHDGKETTA